MHGPPLNNNNKKKTQNNPPLGKKVRRVKNSQNKTLANEENVKTKLTKLSIN